MKLCFLGILILLTSCSSFNLSAMGNEVIEDFPKGKGNGRLLVIIPAKKYSMRKPLFEKISRDATESGYHVVRFNWKFFTERKDPSKNFIKEIKEVHEIIEYYSTKYNYMKKDIVIAAKSFGSRVLAKTKLKSFALGLITPNCSERESFMKTYKEVLRRYSKIQISISINDPYCEIGQIYQELPKIRKEVSIYTTYGDHNFNFKEGVDNQNVFVSQFIQWLRNI